MIADLPITPIIRRYPAIAKACFLIALDNGGIRRDRSVLKWAGEFSRWLERRAEPLAEINRWLGDLTDEQLDTVCTGEATEADAALAAAPAFTQSLLNKYFDPGPC